MPQGQRHLQIFVGVQSRGVFEMAVAQRAGLAQHGDDFFLGGNQVHLEFVSWLRGL